MPEGTETFPSARAGSEEEGRRLVGSGPKLSCWRTYCCGISVLKTLITGAAQFAIGKCCTTPIHDLRKAGLKLGHETGKQFLEVLAVLSKCVSEFILKTHLGGKVKKVDWKEQNLLRGQRIELTRVQRGTVTLLKSFKRSGLNKSTLFRKSITTLQTDDDRYVFSMLFINCFTLLFSLTWGCTDILAFAVPNHVWHTLQINDHCSDSVQTLQLMAFVPPRTC